MITFGRNSKPQPSKVATYRTYEIGGSRVSVLSTSDAGAKAVLRDNGYSALAVTNSFLVSLSAMAPSDVSEVL